jgi:hypothetical protein
MRWRRGDQISPAFLPDDDDHDDLKQPADHEDKG